MEASRCGPSDRYQLRPLGRPPDSQPPATALRSYAGIVQAPRRGPFDQRSACLVQEKREDSSVRGGRVVAELVEDHLEGAHFEEAHVVQRMRSRNSTPGMANSSIARKDGLLFASGRGVGSQVHQLNAGTKAVQGIRPVFEGKWGFENGIRDDTEVMELENADLKFRLAHSNAKGSIGSERSKPHGEVARESLREAVKGHSATDAWSNGSEKI